MCTEKSRGAATIGFLWILLVFAIPVTTHAGHALLIAYPDSKISVDKGTKSRLELGHAGILLISDSGVTRYYEFGRYDRKREGKIRKVSLPNIRYTRPGEVDRNSVLKILKKLSDQSGQKGRILGAYVPEVDYDRMYQFVQKSLRKWPDYHWYSNNCATYADAVLRAGRPSRAPWFNNAIRTPEVMVRDYLFRGAGEVRYDPNREFFCFRPPSGWWNGLLKPGCQTISSR